MHHFQIHNQPYSTIQHNGVWHKEESSEKPRRQPEDVYETAGSGRADTRTEARGWAANSRITLLSSGPVEQEATEALVASSDTLEFEPKDNVVSSGDFVELPANFAQMFRAVKYVPETVRTIHHVDIESQQREYVSNFVPKAIPPIALLPDITVPPLWRSGIPTNGEVNLGQALQYLNNLPWGVSVENLKAAGDVVLQLDPSKQTEVNIVYQRHFDKNREMAFRGIQSSPDQKGAKAAYKLAREIGMELLEVLGIDSWMQIEIAFPDYVPLVISSDLYLEIVRHLDRSDLGDNQAQDLVLLGMAYRLPFDSPLLLQIISVLVDDYPDLVTDLIDYQLYYSYFILPIYGDETPQEKEAITNLKSIRPNQREG